MDSHILLTQIAAIIVTARLFAELAGRMNVPRVIGELFAGILLGPSLLNWIAPSEPIKLLAEIGIILLLFEIGVESDLGRLVRTGTRATVLALAGFVAPFVLGFGLSYFIFEMPMLVSMFVGGTLTATSIGVTVRILADVGRQTSREGHIVLGAAVLDDILGVILLALLYEFSVSGEVSLEKSGRVVLFIAVFFFLAPIAAKLLAFVINHFHRLSQEPGIIPITILALILAMASLAHTVGAPELLGGFVAGIALSRRFFLPLGISLRTDADFNYQMREQMRPVIQIFTPIFFVMVGLSLDLSAVDWGSPFIWLYSITVTVVAIGGKIMAGFLLPENRYVRMATGMAMVPRGEVGLIFAELGRVSGVFEAEVYAAVVIVIAYTTLFSPFWIKLFYRRYGDRMVELEKNN